MNKTQKIESEEENELILQLKNALLDKINDDWLVKWQSEFKIPKFKLEKISKNRLTILLKEDIFYKLREKIDEKEAKQKIVSTDTLKRVLDINNQKGLQNNTKECLAIYLSYENWADFVSKNTKEKTVEEKIIAEQKNEGKKFKLKHFILISIPLILLLLILLQSYNVSQTKILINKQENSKLPKTIYIDYEIPKIGNYYIECTPKPYSGGKEKLLSNKGTIGIYLYDYSIEKASIKRNNQEIKYIYFPILTPKWITRFSIIDDQTNQKTETRIIKNKNFNFNDTLYYTPAETIFKNTHYWVKFQNFKYFNIPSNFFKLSFKFKNNKKTKGIKCFDTQFKVYTSKGNHIFGNLTGTYCSYFSSLSIGGVQYIDSKHSKKGKLLTFNNSTNHSLNMEVKNKKLKLSFDGKSKITISVPELQSEIIGLEFATKGSGKIYDIHLTKCSN